MNLSRPQIIFLAVIGAVVLIAALIFFGVIPGLRRSQEQLSGKITFWGVFDSRQKMDEVINLYRQSRPKVEVEYRELNPETYEADLINALATGRGPDVLMFHNTWLPKHFDKIAPISQQSLTIAEFQNLYPTVAEQDFAPDGIIYALPLYVDTLALFYNKDVFDSAGIALPPKTWEELITMIPKLRQLDQRGRIQRAAAALGGSNKSINRATDILNAMMLQAGVKMVDNDFTRASFGFDGAPVLQFYTSFANPASNNFTWNESFRYSIDAFAEETAAMMLNYSHQAAFLKEKNPFLNFGVAAMPQPAAVQKPVTYANYWGLAVAARSAQINAASDFVLFVAANRAGAELYGKLTGRPPALRRLINEKLNDPTLGVFARQALTARSWPQIDNAKIEEAFTNMIESVLSGRFSVEAAAKQAEDQVTALMRR